MFKTHRYLLAAAAALTTTAAIAGPTCTDAPRDAWLKPEQMQQQIIQAGYSIKQFKVTKGNCYEIYSHDKRGARVEIYYNPVDGTEVRRKVS